MEDTLPTWLELECASEDPDMPDSFCQPRGFVDPTHSDAEPALANRTMAVSITKEGLRGSWMLRLSPFIYSAPLTPPCWRVINTELNLHSQWHSDQWTDSQRPDL